MGFSCLLLLPKVYRVEHNFLGLTFFTQGWGAKLIRTAWIVVIHSFLLLRFPVCDSATMCLSTVQLVGVGYFQGFALPNSAACKDVSAFPRGMVVRVHEIMPESSNAAAPILHPQ